MFTNYTEEQVRSTSKAILDNLELWLRKLIEDTFVYEFGQDYHNHIDDKSNRLIKSSIVKSCNDRIKNEPKRFSRFIDAALLDDLVSIICNPKLYQQFFKIPLSEVFPVGREQAQSVLKKLIDPRNLLAHSNPISIRQAEQIMCYSHDIIDSLKIYYQKMNLEKEYNVPTIVSYYDHLGNKVYNSQFNNLKPNKQTIFKGHLSHYKLHLGDTFVAEVQVDESYDLNSYKTKWLIKGSSLFEIKEFWGNKLTFEIQEVHIRETFGIECYIISKEKWHRFGKYDDCLRIEYQILPL